MNTVPPPFGPLLAELLLPRHCLACQAPLADAAAPLALCRRCHGRLAPVDPRRCCRRCLRPQPASTTGLPCCVGCATRPGALHRLVAVWWYREPLRSVVHAFKFRRLDFLADGLTREALTREPLASLPAIDCVVPVPLALWRRLGRGFNQAERIARQVARALDRPLVDGLARRSLLSRRQSGLGRLARRQNRLSGWTLRSACLPQLVGRSVLLVDDVVTTGATLAALAELLQRSGAREICAFALAATPEQALEALPGRLDRASPAP